MGKANRLKQAAKKRTHTRTGPTQPRHTEPYGRHGLGCDCDEDFWDLHEEDDVFGPPSADDVADEVLRYARLEASGHRAAAVGAAALTDEDFPDHQRAVETGVAIALAGMLEQVWQSGWMPADLWHIAQRRADASAAGLLTDAIAADTERHAAATVHRRWAAQVAQLSDGTWWDESRPHLGQWAEHEGIGMAEALLAAITAVALLITLPALPRIVPPPGTARHAVTAGKGVDQKVLGRVRALLAKAESTQFPEEAEALSAKAQELMNRHAFERAMLDADTHADQVATSSRIWLDSPYIDAKSHLVSAIAAANRCKAVFYPHLGFVGLVGEELDLEITELLTTSLLVQATMAMLAEGSQTTYTGVSRTRSFRRSFLVSYATRIGERLTEAGKAASEDAADERLLPVLASRSKAVEAKFEELFSNTVQRRTTINNGAGWQAGRRAADRADLSIEREAVET
ncbi:MAG: DUF2786 domain-containing protein [Actinophytocola sp.]|nr:DUF2786 domain-containing protein [Actinophytocola sp.]